MAARGRTHSQGARRPSQPARATSLQLATTAPPGKEVRVTGIGERLVTQRRAAWECWYGPVAAARWARACGTRWPGRFWTALTSAPSCSSPSGLHAPAGQVLLVLAAGARLSAYIGATVGEIGFLRGFWMDGSRRLAWLEDYAQPSLRKRRCSRCPTDSCDGIRLEHVSFAIQARRAACSTMSASTCPPARAWPSWARTAPARAPWSNCSADCISLDAGRILIDGADLARMPAEEWRARLAGAFQDFFRFEFRALHTWAWATSPAWMMSRPLWRPSTAPARSDVSERSPAGSRHNSARLGREASNSASANGRNLPSHGDSCATSLCS